jgi:2-oxoisovalerate dehydrogenase E1 component alpha subunit
VDGNDILAVYAATAAARAIVSGASARGTLGALRGGEAPGDVTRPVIIEAMTYRVGAHSTSDDDSKYRTEASPDSNWDSERSYWEARSPIVRFGRFLHARGWFSVGDEEEIRRSARREAIEALNTAEAMGKPPTAFMFTDVWDQPPPALRRQQQELAQHIERHAKHYPGFHA